MMDLIRYCIANANKPGHNEYGYPLHACHGHRCDEHYWAFVRAKSQEAVE